MWAPIVPSAETIADLRAGLPTEQLQYLEVFTKTSITNREFAAYAETLPQSDEEILSSLDQAGITHSLISGFDERSTCGETFVTNEAVAAFAGIPRTHRPRSRGVHRRAGCGGRRVVGNLRHPIIRRG
jgi:predicted TIM-barrel fold metal-dependent hydrolase